MNSTLDKFRLKNRIVIIGDVSFLLTHSERQLYENYHLSL
jgi:hypothetical protein